MKAAKPRPPRARPLRAAALRASVLLACAGHPDRLAMILALERDELHVAALAEALGMTPPTASWARCASAGSSPPGTTTAAGSTR